MVDELKAERNSCENSFDDNDEWLTDYRFRNIWSKHYSLFYLASWKLVSGESNDTFVEIVDAW